MLAFFITTHLLISIILIILILFSQPSSVSATSGIGANISNTGMVGKKIMSFSSKLIMWFVFLFFCNSLIVALLNHKNNIVKIQIPELIEQENTDVLEDGLIDEPPSVPMQ